MSGPKEEGDGAPVEAEERAARGGGDGAGDAAPRGRPLRRHDRPIPALHLQLPQPPHQRLVKKEILGPKVLLPMGCVKLGN